MIKIEPLTGDPMRAYPPFCDGTTTQFAAVNHAKRYLAIDLRSDAGRADCCTSWRRTPTC